MTTLCCNVYLAKSILVIVFSPCNLFYLMLSIKQTNAVCQAEGIGKYKTNLYDRFPYNLRQPSSHTRHGSAPDILKYGFRNLSQ